MRSNSIWKRACALAVAMDFGGGLLSVAVPMVAVKLKADAQWVGIIGSAALAGYTLFCFVSQPLTDRWGRKTSMVLGACFVTIFCVLMTFSVVLKSLWLLGLANFFAGVFYAFFWPAVQAMTAVDAKPEQMLSVLRAYNLSWSSGRMVGTGLSGVLFEIQQVLPFVIATLVSGLVAIASLVLTFPNVKVEDEDANMVNKIPPIVTAAQLGNFVRSFAVIEIVVLLPKIGNEWGWTERQISGLLFLLFAGQIFAFIAAPFVIRQVNWLWVIGTKLAISVFVLPVGNIAQMWLLAFFLLATGIVAGLIAMLSLYLSVTTQGQSVKGSSRHEAGVGAGGVFGPILGGFALKHFFPFFAFLLPLGLTAVTFVFWDLNAIKSKERVGKVA
ncbi:MAG: MFS transporter [Armatimonadota bacterium]|nr:MFS transporter [Armatimonadota bacterium]